MPDKNSMTEKMNPLIYVALKVYDGHTIHSAQARQDEMISPRKKCGVFVSDMCEPTAKDSGDDMVSCTIQVNAVGSYGYCWQKQHRQC
jgi:hypothetical protein